MGPVFHTLLNAKSPKLDPNIIEDLAQWLENTLQKVQSTIQELPDAIHSLANGKAVGPDGVFVELFKIISTVIPPCDGDDIVVLEGGRSSKNMLLS